MTALLFAGLANFLQGCWVDLYALPAVFRLVKFEVNWIMDVDLDRILFVESLWQSLVKFRFLWFLGIMNGEGLIWIGFWLYAFAFDHIYWNFNIRIGIKSIFMYMLNFISFILFQPNTNIWWNRLNWLWIWLSHTSCELNWLIQFLLFKKRMGFAWKILYPVLDIADVKILLDFLFVLQLGPR